jgi:hypothetical protein
LSQKWGQVQTVPDMDVLWVAAKKWHIKWRYLDPSEILRRRKLKTPEQLMLGFLDGVREEDIEVVGVKPGGQADLRVVLSIRFRA